MELAPHAEPFASGGAPRADGKRIGVLLSHGFTGSPASMRPWGEHLAEPATPCPSRGCPVTAPRGRR